MTAIAVDEGAACWAQGFEIRDIPAEQALLGICIHSSAKASETAREITPNSFSEPLHQRIFRAITILLGNERPITAFSVEAALGADPALAEVGGVNYLIELHEQAYMTHDFAEALNAVKDWAARREVWDRLGDVEQQLADPMTPIAHALAPLNLREQLLAERRPDAHRGEDARESEPAPIPILSSGGFVRGFKPPNWSVEGVLQRGYLYSFTGATGSGKTAIGLRLKASTGLARALAGRDVAQGRTLMFAGENPDDVRARWIALSEHMSFDPDEIDSHFIAGIYPIDRLILAAEQKAAELGGFSLVLVDTGAAYFPGEEENSNKQFGEYARTLRRLTAITGQPTVVVNCHPVKGATAENLIPRGGGAFVAEVDGNLTCSKTDAVVQLHWSGKFRGPDFAPIPFELVEVTSPRLVNSKGGPMPTVICKPISDSEQATREDAAARDLQKVLDVMAGNAGASIADIAFKAGWIGASGSPHKSKVHRLLNGLKKDKLVTKELNVWSLTSAGQKAQKRGSK